MTMRRVLEAFAAEPWAIMPEKLQQIAAFLQVRSHRALTPEEIRAAIGPDGTAAPKASISKGIAVLPIHGTLLSRAAPLDESSGVMGTNRLASWFDQLMADDAVSAIVLDVDSPGGMVGGIEEFGRKIAAARGVKPVVAVANTLAASAAYHLASQCEEFVVSPSAEVGSIGVIMVHLDVSKAAEMEGYAFTPIYAGKYKAEGNPYAPLDDEARAALQERVDGFYGMFVKAVAKGRGVTPAEVRGGFGQGRVVGAAEAVKLGMADRIGTLDEVLAKLGGSRGRSLNRSGARAEGPRLAASAANDKTTMTVRVELAEDFESRLAAFAVPNTTTASTAGAVSSGITLIRAEDGDTAADVAVPVPSPALKAKEHTMDNPSTAAPAPGVDPAEFARAQAEQKRLTGLAELGKTYPDFASKVGAWQLGSTTVDQAKNEIIDSLQAKSRTAPSLGVIVGAPNALKDPRKGFTSHREFLLAAMANAHARDKDDVNEERLKPLAIVGDAGAPKATGEGMTFMLPAGFTPPGIRAAAGSDEQGAYDDRYGGFSIPTTTLAGMLQLGMEGDPTAGRTQNVPMQTPGVDIIARTDKNHTSSVSGGFTVTRRPETAAGTSSRMEIEKVALKATGLFGLAYATEELLSDSPLSFVAIIDAGFRDQYSHHLLGEKLRGLGGAEFQGVIGAPATIDVSKESGQAAATINYLNVIKMRSRCWGFGEAIWIANHDTYPQLSVLSIPVGVAGSLVYQQSLQDDRPDRLLGRPIFYSEYASTVGTTGDLILGNWSQFLEGTYQPLQSAESVHVRFVNHERTFKFWMRNAGAPWWRSALTPNKSSSTLSPFITLATRA